MNWKRPYLFSCDRANYLGVVWIRVAQGRPKAQRYFDENDWKTVRRYVEAMKRGARFPIIEGIRWGRQRFVIVEGNHRFLACQILGIEKLPILLFR